MWLLSTLFTRHRSSISEYLSISFTQAWPRFLFTRGSVGGRGFCCPGTDSLHFWQGKNSRTIQFLCSSYSMDFELFAHCFSSWNNLQSVTEKKKSKRENVAETRHQTGILLECTQPRWWREFPPKLFGLGRNKKTWVCFAALEEELWGFGRCWNASGRKSLVWPRTIFTSVSLEGEGSMKCICPFWCIFLLASSILTCTRSIHLSRARVHTTNEMINHGVFYPFGRWMPQKDFSLSPQISLYAFLLVFH